MATLEKKKVKKEDLKKSIISKLKRSGRTSLDNLSDIQIYNAVVSALKGIMVSNRNSFKKRIRASGAKKIYYLCMEFLVGRNLKNVSFNLGIYDVLCEILAELGTSFDKIYELEADPGLGNGGLGRLAACYMDSLTSLDYAATGFSLLYETGLFKQKIVDGEQIELPDTWLDSGAHWLVAHPEESLKIKFGGKISEVWENGALKITNYDYEEIEAVPYDLLVAGTETNATNKIRLWQARSIKDESREYSQYSYIKNRNVSSGELITRQLYPKDDYDEGKLLRLSQQYFLVSASLQSIISDYFRDYGSLSGIEDNIAIHINDTHPALCIPELMRIFMDIYSFSWEDAWGIVVKTVSYTNHTVLPEALECWREDLFSLKLPRIYNIILEINKRFTADLWEMYPGDWDRISRMSIVAYNQVRMANLSVVGSHAVNGVSKLHSDILTKTIFHDFYKMNPWKFTNVTNGIAYRRWLISSNPEYSDFIRELIGDEFYVDAHCLGNLIKYKSDSGVLEKINQIKRNNKEKFANYVYKKSGIKINPDSVYDVQIKRMHEDKRQLLNVLKIMALYQEILADTKSDIIPQTFIFGCKAAPGYTMAKNIIKLIWHLAKEIEANPIVNEKIKIVFVEDYNVSVAERLIPSADISEQISLAGKEASGTGCMKLMMNGAITIGTLDGANVEIRELVGKENIYIFGMNSEEAEELWKKRYNSMEYYHNSKKLKGVIDRFYSPIADADFTYIAKYLLGDGHGIADPFMCLADFDSYIYTYKKAIDEYQNRERWASMSLVNTAMSGKFSSDRAIKEYAEEIWHALPVYKSKR